MASAKPPTISNTQKVFEIVKLNPNASRDMVKKLAALQGVTDGNFVSTMLRRMAKAGSILDAGGKYSTLVDEFVSPPTTKKPKLAVGDKVTLTKAAPTPKAKAEPLKGFTDFDLSRGKNETPLTDIPDAKVDEIISSCTIEELLLLQERIQAKAKQLLGNQS